MIDWQDLLMKLKLPWKQANATYFTQVARLNLSFLYQLDSNILHNYSVTAWYYWKARPHFICRKVPRVYILQGVLYLQESTPCNIYTRACIENTDNFKVVSVFWIFPQGTITPHHNYVSSCVRLMHPYMSMSQDVMLWCAILSHILKGLSFVPQLQW